MTESPPPNGTESTGSQPGPMRVRDIMQARVITVPPDTNLPELHRRFTAAKVGALPVLDRQHRMQGIVSRTDVMRRFSLEQSMAELADSDFDQTLGVEDRDDSIAVISEEVGRRLSKLHASDIMIRDVITIGPDEPLAEAARRMVDRRIHRLPVVEDDRLIGILSAFDFMRLYASTNA